MILTGPNSHYNTHFWAINVNAPAVLKVLLKIFPVNDSLAFKSRLQAAIWRKNNQSLDVLFADFPFNKLSETHIYILTLEAIKTNNTHFLLKLIELNVPDSEYHLDCYFEIAAKYNHSDCIQILTRHPNFKLSRISIGPIYEAGLLDVKLKEIK